MKFIKYISLAMTGVLALTMGANANILTQEQSYTGLTDWAQNLTFDQFNPTLGTLNSVTIALNGSVVLASSINNSGAGTASFSIGDDFTMESTVPENVPLTLDKEVDQSYSIASGAGTGQTSTGSASRSQTITGDLSGWEGIGTVVLSADAEDEFSYRITGGNNAVNITTTAELDATVTYDYNAVPDSPLSVWMSAFPLMVVCGAAIRLKKEKRQMV